MTKRKNAGEGYGYQFHGAFTKKADAVKKERTRKGAFVKGIPTAKGYRYIVFTPRTNPRRRKNLSRSMKVEGKTFHNWEKASRYARKLAKQKGDRIPVHVTEDGYTLTHYIDPPEHRAHHRGNAMDLVVMGANPPAPAHKEIVVEPGQTITLRVNPAAVNPSGEICGHLIGGLPCTREPGHSGPHLPQGATLRPASRHNWGRSNPTGEIYEAFTGQPSQKITIFDEPHMSAGNYDWLAKLLVLYVKPLTRGQVLEIKGRGVVMVADKESKIWFVGGDQDVTAHLEQFGARPLGQGRYELGEAVRIDYKQRKEHAPHPEKDEWKHFFGEESNIRPAVHFDAIRKRLFLVGGDYRIEERGIIN